QPGASFLAFALFMGISMSITAFPVLVRILQDRGIFKTSLGITATACAAVDDVTAWSMLAFVVAIARATSVGGAAFNLGLVPVFFAFTGLRTQIGLLNSAQDWLICLVIIGVATAGKLGGSALAARLTGMKWPESLQLGALMNTRGLMELIALNIGYDMGILSQ